MFPLEHRTILKASLQNQTNPQYRQVSKPNRQEIQICLLFFIWGIIFLPNKTKCIINIFFKRKLVLDWY